VVYLVSQWALIHEVLRNQRDYSANLTGILIRGADGAPELFELAQFGGTIDALANADEPFHAVHRKLVLPQLNARAVAALEGEVRHWADAAVAKLVAAGGGDCVGALANDIPVKVMARLAGLPVEDVDQLLDWAFGGGDLLAGTADLARMAALGASTSELAAYLKRHFERTAAADFDEPGSVLQELVRGVQRGLVDESAAIGILVVLVGAAGESTSSLVGSAIRLLAQDAGLQGRLRQQPHLIDAFVEEVVRLESPFKGHYRVALNPTSLGDTELPAGSRVFLLWAAANRDPAVFTNPDRLEPGRPDGGNHLGFGHGIHFCIGARVARMEARIILQELLAQTRGFTLDPALPPAHVPSIFVRRLAALHLLLDG
ncbi:MAG: cytochrome P450, partial [Halioglobus sp.]|nr:cytochrome P450 [Halioglobus sp.]